MRKARSIATVTIMTVLFAMAAMPAFAQDDDDAMSPVEPEGQGSGFAVVGLALADSTGSGDALVGATSTSASSIELHQTIGTDDSGMTMTVVDAIPVPAGGQVVLEPSGYHLMLVEPIDSVAPGGTIELELVLDVAGTIPVTAAVIPLEGSVVEAPVAVALPASISVEALDNFFVPDTLEAPANTEIKVTLKNYGFLPHNIAFYTDETASQLLADGALTSVIDPETEAIARFTTPGPGEYFILCVIHPEMTGTLIVR